MHTVFTDPTENGRHKGERKQTAVVYDLEQHGYKTRDHDLLPDFV